MHSPLFNCFSLLRLSPLRRPLRGIAAALGSLLLCAACNVNPVSGDKEFGWLDESWETRIGEQHYRLQQQAGGGLYRLDPALSRYVATIGAQLAQHSQRAHLPYEFVVLNHSSANAWALPGGKIALNRGLLLALHDEAELAAVLAHEIVHVDARHSAQRQEVGQLIGVAQLATQALLANAGLDSRAAQQGIAYGSLYGQTHYSRGRELQADRLGMHYMQRAGYDVSAAVQLQQTFVSLSQEKNNDHFSALFASHPPSPARVEANRDTAAQLPSGGELGTKRFAEAMATLQRQQPAYQHADQALEALRKKDYLQAIDLADKAIAIEPKESLFYQLKGRAQMQLNRSAEALRSLDRAVQLNDDYYAPSLWRGLLHYSLQSYRAAERDLRASLALAPSQVAHIKLAQIAERQQRCNDAAEHYRQALALATKKQQRATLQQRIEALQVSCLNAGGSSGDKTGEASI